MRYAMMSYTMAIGDWGKDCDVAELCHITSTMGIEGIDWVTTYGVSPREVKILMDDHGLKTVCYTFDVDVNFPERSARQAGVDDIKRGIDTALILGTDRVMLPFPGKDAFSREESRANIIAGLSDAMDYAKSCGVMISTEHFSTPNAPFIVSADMNAAIRELPDLKVTFDSGNVLIGGENPVDGFLRSKESIVHVHFKDFAENGCRFTGLDGRLYDAALIGEGIVDYPPLVAAMIDAGYDGWINIEYESGEYPADKAVRKAIDYLKSIEDRLMEPAGSKL